MFFSGNDFPCGYNAIKCWLFAPSRLGRWSLESLMTRRTTAGSKPLMSDWFSFWQQWWYLMSDLFTFGYDIYVLDWLNLKSMMTCGETLQVELAFLNPQYDDIETDWDTGLLKVDGQVLTKGRPRSYLALKTCKWCRGTWIWSIINDYMIFFVWCLHFLLLELALFLHKHLTRNFQSWVKILAAVLYSLL